MITKRKRLFFIVSFIILFISGCAMRENEVQLTRRIFNALCRGNQRVQNLIDWETFKAAGVDVGQAYSNIVSEKERADYRKAFFYNLSFSFRASGARTSAFSNWRIIQEDGINTIVGADTVSGKTLLFTISIKNGKQKLTAIQWQ